MLLLLFFFFGGGGGGGAGIIIIFVRIANREDPDQTVSSEAVWPCLHCLHICFFGRELVFEIF